MTIDEFEKHVDDFLASEPDGIVDIDLPEQVEFAHIQKKLIYLARLAPRACFHRDPLGFDKKDIQDQLDKALQEVGL